MLAILCVLVTCVSFAGQAGADPNQTPQQVSPAAVTQSASASDANVTGTQAEPAEARGDDGSDSFHWWDAVPWFLTLALLALYIWQYYRRKADARIKTTAELEAKETFSEGQKQKVAQTAEDQYKSVLVEELGTIQVLGTHEIANIPVDLLETFVSLDISPTSQTDCMPGLGRQAIHEQGRRHLTPESALKRAFEAYRMLLILGDAGSGKTTLLKYYAMLCLKGDRYRDLGFSKPPLPVYFPLRDVEFQDGAPCLLHQCLSKWAKKHYKKIPAATFLTWLNERDTLILLDGLDEVSDLAKRRKVCEWIDATAKGIGRARLVVTSRWTGYGKLDEVQLGFGHLMAEIKGFSDEQQSQFLRKWFVAAYSKEPRDEGEAAPHGDLAQDQRGLDRAQAIIDFLALDQNKGVRELAAVPMLLQIVAIIWKEHENLPQGRAELYEAAVKYLVDYRDRRRHLVPPLKAAQALRTLSPISLWMQEELRSEEVPKEALHLRMQPIIRTMDVSLTAETYCEYLRDRAALLADYGQGSYIFRHKSFREYLTGLELVKECRGQPRRVAKIVRHLGDDWWEEPLRFFMGEVDDVLFDRFMYAFFRSPVSKELDQKAHNLLLLLVAEAVQTKETSLVKCLRDKRFSDNKKRYIVDCLKTIGSPEALAAVEQFAGTATGGAAVAAARDIAEQRREVAEPEARVRRITDVFAERPNSFRNPFELNAEYLRIPGGSFAYSVTHKTESVRDLYFAKYPVTNQRYRLFVNYLAGGEARLGELLSREVFSKGLLALAAEESGFNKYLGGDAGQWAAKLKSGYDAEKRFKGEDQPVVGVSWFDANAYCLWLSMLEAAAQGVAIERLEHVYRLPSEIEWEWAAAGRERDGGLRQYPWPLEKGEPNDKLTNYAGNVGATTAVGRYPEGATPEGLMDMAGNVWEWMENLHGDKGFPNARSLRGGSWGFVGGYLRCSARGFGYPENRDDYFGFRVVCSQP